jgi:enediyne biosynthesis protein E4
MRWRGGRWSAVILSTIVIGGLGWCGWRWWEVHRYRQAMAAIDEAMRSGLYATAVRDLSALLHGSHGSERAAYLLGICEKARGRFREADAAWAAIPSGSLFSKRAVAGRMDLLIEQGRLADAEQLIDRAADDDRSEASALRTILVPILVHEGRTEEAQRLIESRWRSLDARGDGSTEQAVNLARLHMELRWNVLPVEVVREYLDQVGRLAPEDDRIRLGRANLAIRTASYDEAKKLIDECLRRQPDDRAVWRARLDWAMRTDRLDEARAALKHLPAELATPAEVHRLSAWLASRCGDVERERDELAARVAEAPEDFEALERLETLERQSAKSPAARPRRRRADIERDRMRYRELYRRNQPARDAEEMASLAERLGHRFEAILYLTAAIAEEPDRADLRGHLHRLGESARGPGGANRSLFDELPSD